MDVGGAGFPFLPSNCPSIFLRRTTGWGASIPPPRAAPRVEPLTKLLERAVCETRTAYEAVNRRVKLYSKASHACASDSEDQHGRSGAIAISCNPLLLSVGGRTASTRVSTAQGCCALVLLTSARSDVFGSNNKKCRPSRRAAQGDPQAPAQGPCSQGERRARRRRGPARPGTGPSAWHGNCLLYTSPSPRDATLSRMPSSA